MRARTTMREITKAFETALRAGAISPTEAATMARTLLDAAMTIEMDLRENDGDLQGPAAQGADLLDSLADAIEAAEDL